MTDPAETAARRAFTAMWPEQGDQEFNFSAMCNDGRWAIDSAREALAPLKELHKPCEPYLNDNPYDTDETITDCVECEVRWPCDTAALIYSDAELNPEGTTP